ncbi:MAG: hypothetical protein HY063_07220 [Bacteroidetes bacterium]|nr:hypothetical protein [Bacteroidota bacterium]
MKIFFLFIFCFLFFIPLFSQDDLLKMLDSTSTPDKSVNKVTATFKTLKVISMQTPQTVGAGELDFRITHRFGNIGSASGGGVHTLYGWDAISDVRISFDYGITNHLQVGVGRSKRDENIDASIKYRFLEQTTDNKIPLSISAYSIASLTPQSESQLYSGADSLWVNDNKKFAHRMVYTTQIILARKFAPWFSLAITPSYTHRNYVLANVNPDNSAVDENDLLAVGAGIRLKLSRSFSLLADYFYVSSSYRKNNSANPYYNPLAVGIEIETGGHVFHLNFTNAAGITENYFIPKSPDSWKNGGYKFGFNISRVFQIASKGKKEKK